MNNLEWLYRNDYEIMGYIDSHVVGRCYGGVLTLDEASGWLLSPCEWDGENAPESHGEATSAPQTAEPEPEPAEEENEPQDGSKRKTKKQLRAEAVERLKSLRYHTNEDILRGVLGWGHEPHFEDNAAENALIDLLTDEHQNDYDAWQLQMDELTAERDGLKAIVKFQQSQIDASDFAFKTVNEEYDKLDRKCDELKAERDKWKTKCETREVAYKQADAERERYSEQIDKLFAERDKLQAKVDSLTDKIGEITDEASELMKKQPYTFDAHDVPGSLRTVGRYIDELFAERDKLLAELEAYSDFEKAEFAIPLDEAMKFTTDPPGYVKKYIAELQAERDYWKDQVHQCVIKAVKPGGYTAGIMCYPRTDGYCEPSLIVTDAIDSLKDFYADEKRLNGKLTAELERKQRVIDVQRESFRKIETDCKRLAKENECFRKHGTPF